MINKSQSYFSKTPTVPTVEKKIDSDLTKAFLSQVCFSKVAKRFPMSSANSKDLANILPEI